MCRRRSRRWRRRRGDEIWVWNGEMEKKKKKKRARSGAGAALFFLVPVFESFPYTLDQREKKKEENARGRSTRAHL